LAGVGILVPTAGIAINSVLKRRKEESRERKTLAELTSSITYWNRLEPRPKANQIHETLAARIRDPLWMLTRQWQMGEFRGEDAGSPAYVEMVPVFSSFVEWQPTGGPARMLSATAPIEAIVESEQFRPDMALRVELGQSFEALLIQRGRPDLIDAFRARALIT